MIDNATGSGRDTDCRWRSRLGCFDNLAIGLHRFKSSRLLSTMAFK